MGIDIRDVVSDAIGSVGLTLLSIIFIYVLVIFRNAIEHSSGTQVAGIINQGIFTLLFIFSIIGVVGFIRLVLWVIRSFGYSRFEF